MSRNLFKIIALEWWTQDLASGVWLCLLHSLPRLPHHSADQLSLPPLSHQAGKSWWRDAHQALLPINFLCCPCSSPSPARWSPSPDPQGDSKWPWGWGEGCHPLVQLAWPERSEHVQCKALLTHSSGAGAVESSREGNGLDVQFRGCPLHCA